MDTQKFKPTLLFYIVLMSGFLFGPMGYGLDFNAQQNATQQGVAQQGAVLLDSAIESTYTNSHYAKDCAQCNAHIDTLPPFSKHHKKSKEDFLIEAEEERDGEERNPTSEQDLSDSNHNITATQPSFALQLYHQYCNKCFNLYRLLLLIPEQRRHLLYRVLII